MSKFFISIILKLFANWGFGKYCIWVKKSVGYKTSTNLILWLEVDYLYICSFEEFEKVLKTISRDLLTFFWNNLTLDSIHNVQIILLWIITFIKTKINMYIYILVVIKKIEFENHKKVPENSMMSLICYHKSKIYSLQKSKSTQK